VSSQELVSGNSRARRASVRTYRPAAGPAAGQRISGLITNQQGNPVVGVLLRWTHPQGQTTTAFSDAAGLYQIDLASSLWWRPT